LTLITAGSFGVFLTLTIDEPKHEVAFAASDTPDVPVYIMTDEGLSDAGSIVRGTMVEKYKEAEERIRMAIEGRKCDFCQYCGCVDAYCAWVYLCCIRGDEEGAAKYREAGLAICAYDRDLLHYPDYFMTKKRGLFK